MVSVSCFLLPLRPISLECFAAGAFPSSQLLHLLSGCLGGLPHLSRAGQDTPLRPTSVGDALLFGFLVLRPVRVAATHFLRCCIEGPLCPSFSLCWFVVWLLRRLSDLPQSGRPEKPASSNLCRCCSADLVHLIAAYESCCYRFRTKLH